MNLVKNSPNPAWEMLVVLSEEPWSPDPDKNESQKETFFEAQ